MLDAAVAVFSRRGFHAAGMDEIADEAGISKPMVYAYLGTKEELFVACLHREGTRLMEAIARVVEPDLPPDEQLWRGIRAFFAFVAAHRDGWGVLYRQARGQEPFAAELAGMRRRMIEVVAGLLERAVTRAGAAAPAAAVAAASVPASTVAGPAAPAGPAAAGDIAGPAAAADPAAVAGVTAAAAGPIAAEAGSPVGSFAAGGSPARASSRPDLTAMAYALVGVAESLADWAVEHPGENAETTAARMMNFVWLGADARLRGASWRPSTCSDSPAA